MSLLASLAKPHTTPVTSKGTQPVVACIRTRKAGEPGYATSTRSRLSKFHSEAAANVKRESRLEDFFVQALVQAGTCTKHRAPGCLGLPQNHLRLRGRDSASSKGLRVPARPFSSSHGARGSAAQAIVLDNDAISREEYQELVNTYPAFHPNDLTPAEKAAKRAKHPALAPRLFLTAEQEDRTTPGLREVLPPENREHSRQIQSFLQLLSRDVSPPTHNKLWRAFEALPGPRLRYLSDQQIRLIFMHLTWTQYKTHPEAMQRYFALLEECSGERVVLPTEVWNTAIAFAGQWVRKVSSVEVKSAVETWMRMEQAGRRADRVTLHILFHVAVKAGRFALADTLYNEMNARGWHLSRYFRTSIIYYAGMRRDGDGVRQAFRDLVNASDIVDTTVMNCVVLSLIRAGEAPAAEHVFLKMKRLHEQKLGTVGPRDWAGRKRLGRVLSKTGFVLRELRQQHESSFFGATFSSDAKREEIQTNTPIAPDAGTYQILVRHHASTSGNIGRIRELVAEMQRSGWQVHGSLYVQILRGFWIHGGFPYSPWNREALESLWSDLITALEAGTPNRASDPATAADDHDLLGAMLAEAEGQKHTGRSTDDDNDGEDDVRAIPLHARPPTFNKALAFAAIRAFYKCVGRERMLGVWAEMLLRWEDITDDEKAELQDQVDRCVQEDSMYV